MSASRQAFILVGPTAVGKSDVAEFIARRHGLPILSADSMMVYRGMDIGTAKPSADVRREIVYWGLDLADPDSDFSAGQYLQAVVRQMGDQCLLLCAGGTGLYVRCLVDGLREVPARNDAWRAEAETILERDGVPGLQRAVSERAPAAYARLRDPSNPRRLIRALEIGEQPNPPAPAPKPRLVGLTLSRELLLERIARRVEAMYEGGLLNEVEALTKQYPGLSATARQAIGYAEALTHLSGACTLAAAKEKTIVRTRQLAKRQLTWFRNQADMDWIEIRQGQSVDEIAGAVEDRWEINGATHLAY